MKKLMKKGSLLIVWSLLLAMMFGMSVHATEYDLEYMNTLTEGQILNPDDTLKMDTSNFLLDIFIDSINVDDRIVVDVNDISVFTVRQGEHFKVEDIIIDDSYPGRKSVYLVTYTPPSSTPDNNTNAAPAPEKPAPAPEKEEDKHEHNWEWIQIQAATDSQDGVEAMCCTECGQQGESRTIVSSAYGVFCGETKDKITGATENATVEMETEIWSSLPKSVMDAIKERRDLTVNLTLTYQNKEYPLSIPAGYDMSVLEEADWYGVLYLNQFFGVANQ